MSAKHRKRLTKDERDQVYAKTDGLCWYCGAEIRYKWHVEHQDGRREAAGFLNLVAACPTCNASKGARDVEDFKRKILEAAARKVDELFVMLEGLEEDSHRYGWLVEEDLNHCREAIGDLRRALETSNVEFYGERPP
jgi:hypothetical protein